MKKRKRKNKKKKVKPANHSKEHPERKSCEKRMKEKEIDQQKQRKTKLAVGKITPLDTPYNWVSAPYLGSHFLKHQIFF